MIDDADIATHLTAEGSFWAVVGTGTLPEYHVEAAGALTAVRVGGPGPFARIADLTARPDP